MPLVAGVDSSTQSCKIVIRDAATGALVRSGRAAHPDGTEVDPAAWWGALLSAFADAGGFDGIEAVSVGGQQHGMVVLDADGRVGPPACRSCRGQLHRKAAEHGSGWDRQAERQLLHPGVQGVLR
jgi:sugar (pentulose or hexulose) kinase